MVKKVRKKKSDASTMEAAEAVAGSCSSDAVDTLLIPSTKTSKRPRLPHQPKQFARFKGSISKLINEKLSDKMEEMLHVVMDMVRVVTGIEFIVSSKGAVVRTTKTARRYIHWKRKKVSVHIESLNESLTRLGELVLKVPRNLSDEIETSVYSLVLKHLEPPLSFLRQEREKVELCKRELDETGKAKACAAGRGDTAVHSRFHSENRRAANEGLSEELGVYIFDSEQKPSPRSLLQRCDEGGFYSGEVLNPKDLVNAVTMVRTHMTSFSKCFSNALQADANAESRAVLNSRWSSVQFIRKHHVVSYGLKASLGKILYRGFENEDFRSGIIGDVDPHKRRQAFTEYFRLYKDRLWDDLSRDELFSTFTQIKLRRLAKKFRMRVGHDSRKNVTTQILEDFGGPQLVAAFNCVVVGAWLLHKVAFAFLTPATILRFGSSSVVYTDYMDPVEERDDGFVKVGFTVSPGFRLGQTVTKAEVYPG
ncbi:hypothetical protein R1sor_027397 [Riccia sorocarpa]|uniref:GIL1/IRKI C-terminal domain-containing protein n=1 Tax=Riccia sorocarpa TaxID=122646 RepID=A0ABD3GJU3_9MARC